MTYKTNLRTRRARRASAVFVLAAAAATALPAQTLTTLFTFDQANGGYPEAALVQATDGNLYGTTNGFGANNGGTVFKISTDGTLTTLYNFCSQTGCTDGENPTAGLVQATNGDLYGTTFGGGTTGNGTVFRAGVHSGRLTTIYNFCPQSGCADGSGPEAGLVQAANGDLYGTTNVGGTQGHAGGSQGDGTVFRMSPRGALAATASFNGADGCGSYAGLVQATDGDLYGTTAHCGAFDGGTIFRMSTSGAPVLLYSFCSQGFPSCTDGSYPWGGALVEASDGNLYGTTSEGGAYAEGTVFSVTPAGALTTLYSFCAQGLCKDGERPYAGLVQGTDGNLYGTTYYGGAYDSGTVFKITPAGTLTTLVSFTNGEWPYAGLVQATDGDFYGTTEFGGASDAGTVFRLSVGLGPFVKTLPIFGAEGAAVKILGTDLTGATSVTFDGTAAVFDVVSATEITATVPSGATTGTVQVVTPGGTLSSNLPFRVL